jgi:hypothetical protein
MNRTVSKVARGIGRGAVFVIGAGFGLLAALVFGSWPGGTPPVVTLLEILSVLALALAAPVCWYFAVHGEAGDRWTLAYVLTWVAWFVVLLLSVAIF